jgi:Mg2+-importing ATPase
VEGDELDSFNDSALAHLVETTVVFARVSPMPRRWNIRLIRDFMIFLGPISSIYDFLTF